jgi:hypothetical protein
MFSIRIGTTPNPKYNYQTRMGKVIVKRARKTSTSYFFATLLSAVLCPIPQVFRQEIVETRSAGQLVLRREGVIYST